jgi:cell division protein FtsL
MGYGQMKSVIIALHKHVMGKAGRISPAYQVLLLIAVVLCALSVVTSQHKARKLFIELQKEKEQAQQMDVEWGQLQLEQSTWATPARVEHVAVQKLHMQLPKNGQIQIIRVKPNGETYSLQ